jgi:hypothetical protein
VLSASAGESPERRDLTETLRMPTTELAELASFDALAATSRLRGSGQDGRRILEPCRS